MACRTYIVKRFSKESQEIIDHANEILDDYSQQGYVLTLRQLYYQFVSRDLLPNVPKSYEKLSSVISDARLAGRVDWDMLIDRTRHLAELEHFTSAADALQKLAGWYHINFWDNQKYRPEVWIEKDALVGVIEGVCQSYDVPYFSCRGYTSQTEMWKAARRMVRTICDEDKIPYIIHLGDHDPSGIDMSRDIQDRIGMFLSEDVGEDTEWEFHRIALNMDQIFELSPPPNPAKITDSRAKGYIEKFGNESWELDALEPTYMENLVRDHILGIIDNVQWNKDVAHKKETRNRLVELAKEWK